MNIAVLHYHLNRGGVTQVIINHLLSLERHLRGERWRVAIMYGGRQDAWMQHLTNLKHLDVQFVRIAGLDYATDEAPSRCEALGEEIRRQLDDLRFDLRETVIHIHNHSLAKNASLPGAIVWLADRGHRLLLQIHDFSEDFRPGDYKQLQAAAYAAEKTSRHGGESPSTSRGRDVGFSYPQAPNIHYAVLNSRDDEILAQAGVPDAQRELLPNPVAEPAEWRGRREARKKLKKLFGVPRRHQFVLYPVRCIRRKNIGEAMLWSLLSRENVTYGFTLPPENPATDVIYQSWRRLAQTEELPCRFEIGADGGMRYVESVAAADLLLTTSLVEGFGMVYLESWLSGHMLAGRDLPEITADFVNNGMSYDRIQPHLHVNIDWFGARRFEELLQSGYQSVTQTYGVSPSNADKVLQERVAQRLDEGWVDFGEIDEQAQHRVIEKVAGNAPARKDLEESNPWCRTAMRNPLHSEVSAIVRNAVTAVHRFGFDRGGRRLAELYSRVLGADSNGAALPLRDPQQILDRFLDPHRYRPIAVAQPAAEENAS